MKLPAWARLFLWGHGLYFLVTGVWPIVSPGTFQRITGPKTDMWVVKTLGMVLVLAGGAVLFAAGRRRAAPETALVGAGSAAALAAADVIYVAKGRIAPIYLLDALAEAALLGGWFGMRSYVDWK